MNTKKIKCLVVDDEHLARTLLSNYIEKLPNLEQVGACKNALDAIAFLQKEKIDLIFLDIQMPDLTGIEFLNTLQKKPLVIFTTAYQKYAIDGYQLDIVDYLLKPFRFDRFVQAVNKAERRLISEGDLKSEKKDTEVNDFILIKADHATHKILLNDILYIQSMKEYVAFHLPEKRIISLMSLKQLEQDFPKNKFLRIHRSYIIANNKVTSVDGNHVYIGKDKFPIGGIYKDDIRKYIF